MLSFKEIKNGSKRARARQLGVDRGSSRAMTRLIARLEWIVTFAPRKSGMARLGFDCTA
jgi:hypothetical protein